MVDYSTTTSESRAMRRRADRELLRMTLKFVLVIVGCVFGVRFFHGNFMLLLALAGVLFAAKGQMGKVFFIYLLVPFLVILNPVLLPKVGLSGLVARIAVVAITATLVFSASQRKGHDQIPIGGIFFFLVAALISSIQGWFPLISYLKLINVSVFFLGVYYGTRNLGFDINDLFLIRCVMLAFSCIIVFGSLLVLPFPHVGYFTALSSYYLAGGAGFADEVFYSAPKSSLRVFCGVTMHSQFLAPFLACISGWVSCDMILVEKKANLLHLALLAVIPFLLFLTRSRAGSFAYVISWLVIVGFGLRHIRVSWILRRRLKRMVWMCLVFLIGVVVVSEVNNQTISKLLRKTNQVEEDSRSLKQAVTNSRQGLIARCLSEFRRNPMLGSGFQVQQEHRELYRRKAISLYSAPIEKGILPLMVLGETGFVGFSAFVGFLCVFFGTCVRRRYIATATLFLVYLSTNMAEATFFAPSGGGGVMWLISLVGGFTIDMTVKHGNILFEEMRTLSSSISPIPVSPAVRGRKNSPKGPLSSMLPGVPSKGAFL